MPCELAGISVLGFQESLEIGNIANKVGRDECAERRLVFGRQTLQNRNVHITVKVLTFRQELCLS